MANETHKEELSEDEKLNNKLFLVLDDYLTKNVEIKNILAISIYICEHKFVDQLPPGPKTRRNDKGRLQILIPKEFLNWSVEKCQEYLKPFYLESTTQLFLDSKNYNPNNKK